MPERSKLRPASTSAHSLRTTLASRPTKSKTKLGWEPKYDLKGLVEDMMQSDIKLFKKDAYLKEGGYQVMNYFE